MPDEIMGLALLPTKAKAAPLTREMKQPFDFPASYAGVKCKLFCCPQTSFYRISS